MDIVRVMNVQMRVRTYTQNIHDPSTRSQASERENRTRNGSNNYKDIFNLNNYKDFFKIFCKSNVNFGLKYNGMG